VLGLEPKLDIPMGEHRWLTLTSPGEPDGVQLLLEPDGHPAASHSRRRSRRTASPLPPSRWTTSTPSTPRLSSAGVRFTQPPTAMGPVTTAVFDDTCGNLIQIAQRH
jgi:hypothetical protein